MIQKTLGWCVRAMVIILIVSIFLCFLLLFAVGAIAIIRMMQPGFMESIHITEELIGTLVTVSVVGPFIMFMAWDSDILG
jgi:hypothetical protein